jgi:hypothetical protein
LNEFKVLLFLSDPLPDPTEEDFCFSIVPGVRNEEIIDSEQEFVCNYKGRKSCNFSELFDQVEVLLK